MGKFFEAIKAEAEKNMKDKKIVKVTLIDSDSKKSGVSAIGRGLVGGVLLGGVGALAGAVSAKNKKETTFKVEYESGRVEVVTCKNNSKEYKKYIKMI